MIARRMIDEVMRLLGMHGMDIDPEKKGSRLLRLPHFLSSF